jgi:hypothetical protein
VLTAAPGTTGDAVAGKSPCRTTTTVASTTTSAAATTTSPTTTPVDDDRGGHHHDGSRAHHQTAAATTTTTAAGGIWRPEMSTPWHWMIDHRLNLNDPKDMGLTDPAGNPLPGPAPLVYDIDWEMNPASVVSSLHAMGKKVICYVDVGVYEDYRGDAWKFPPAVIGSTDVGWDGSWWLTAAPMQPII